MRSALFISMLALASPAGAEPFGAPPSRYAETVNPALQGIGTDLRIRQASCVDGTRCRFAARLVDIEVVGPADRPGTERIQVTATFRQGDDAAATRLLDDILTVVGATMVAYDPGMAAERRGEALLELGEAALSVGEAHLDSTDVHYALSFDDVSGRLEIIAATLRASHGCGKDGTKPGATC
ncbi:hypothetical protein [Microvirga guangxiensis]|uniref:Uncharacterized protein n=1 Tax=Microvirga guangxiensis TaxID=549386 RepID=A0A1G5L8X4_9HYPH|nr:hypothetical protein [Microvirga guangxiensis]SCZ08609.1 hypothetical protein SAMN02927923_03971 [Microvirga guangxiensis]